MDFLKVSRKTSLILMCVLNDAIISLRRVLIIFALGLALANSKPIAKLEALLAVKASTSLIDTSTSLVDD